jgi:hypothetical protein
MDSPDKYKSNIAFIDLLFNILVGFVFLFVIAFIMINPVAKKGDIITPAQFLITMTWPGNLNDDIDLWVQDPAGNVVGFMSKDKGIMNLDRDDLGSVNDEIQVGGETIKININQEVVSLRGIVAGEYYISVHYYRRDTINPPEPFPVKILVTKINPYSIVYQQEQTFSSEGEIINYYSFQVDPSGYIMGVHESMTNVVPQHRRNLTGSQPRTEAHP